MRKEIHLKLPPFSINRMYYSDLKAKTADAREWSAQVFWQLNNETNQEVLKELREYFNPKLHAFGLNMVATYPKENYFNKEGTISARTIDISNWEKPIIDLVFGPKYFDAPVPYGVKNINADDRYVQYCNSKKVAHDLDHCLIKIEIEIISLDSIVHG